MKYFTNVRNKLLGALCAISLGATAFTPAFAADPIPLGNTTIVYGHAAWSSSRMLYALSRALLEKIGYTVQNKVLDTGIIYASMASGQVEVFSSAWLPGQQSYLNKYGDKLDILSFSIVPAPGGLMVPSYMSISSIEDLKKDEVAKQLDGKIIGIDAGAGISLGTKKVIEQYGLPLQLVASSDAAMSTAFKAAYEQKKPIVITGWCPHVICALYDVKLLEDPKRIYGQDRDLNIVSANFRAQHPRATAFLSRYTLTDKQLSQMLAWVDVEKMTDAQAVDRFIKENEALIWYMIGGLSPDIKKPASLN
jgi:glycine betaine/proline transport system substrate-binding protein